MKFVLDENFPFSAASWLTELGHDAVDVRSEGLGGSKDDKLFEFCQNLGAVFLTTDRDFFHTIPHLYPKHHGVLVIALKQPNRVKILSKLNWFLENFASMEIHGRVFQLRDNTWSVYPQLSNPKNDH